MKENINKENRVFNVPGDKLVMIEVNTRNARAELADHLISDLLGAHTVGHDNDIANIGRPFVKKTDVDNQSLDSKVDGEDVE